jgi:hypothetical protein
MRRGHLASPRVAISEIKTPKIAPRSVAAAAIFTVSISEGRNFHISPGRLAIFSAASDKTSPGNWKMLPIPSQKPPALRPSATRKPETISAMNTMSITDP